MESVYKAASEYTVLVEQWWHSQARKDIVTFRNPMEIWAENPSFLLCEIIFVTWALVTFRHGKYCVLLVNNNIAHYCEVWVG